jgi:hypothetical protein
MPEVAPVEFLRVSVPEPEIGGRMRRGVKILHYLAPELIGREAELVRVPSARGSIWLGVITDAPAVPAISLLEEENEAIRIDIGRKNHLPPLADHRLFPFLS